MAGIAVPPAPGTRTLPVEKRWESVVRERNRCRDAGRCRRLSFRFLFLVVLFSLSVFGCVSFQVAAFVLLFFFVCVPFAVDRPYLGGEATFRTGEEIAMAAAVAAEQRLGGKRTG